MRSTSLAFVLQHMCGAVGFERPHLHLAKALTAEARLAAERLLGDEGVPVAHCVDLVVDEVVQLQNVETFLSLLARNDRRYARRRGRTCHLRQAGFPAQLANVLFLGAVENRRDGTSGASLSASSTRYVSRIWPRFIRDGTPSGLRMTSTLRSVVEVRTILHGQDLGDHALVAWRGGFLSPTDRLRLVAT